jgi:hypothetical protein
MTEEKLLWFLDLVDKARQGDAAAKAMLLVNLETERRPAILSKLSDGDVRPVDRPDAHHDVIVKIHNNIQRLRVTRSYFRYEDRIIKDVCRQWRRSYWSLGESLEVVQQTSIRGDSNEWEAAPRRQVASH